MQGQLSEALALAGALLDTDTEAKLSLHTTLAALEPSADLHSRLLGLMPQLVKDEEFVEWLASSAMDAGSSCARLFSGDAVLVKRFFSEDKRIVSWFARFSMKGITHFEHGSKSLAEYALAHRDRVWDLLVWSGKHAQTPATAGLKTHYFCELTVLPTVRNFLAECPDFWESHALESRLQTSAWISCDPPFFVQEAESRIRQDARNGSCRFARRLLSGLLASSRARAAAVASCLGYLSDADAVACISECLPRPRCMLLSRRSYVGLATCALRTVRPPSIPNPSREEQARQAWQHKGVPQQLLFSAVKWRRLADVLRAHECLCTPQHCLRRCQAKHSEWSQLVGLAEAVWPADSARECFEATWAELRAHLAAARSSQQTHGPLTGDTAIAALQQCIVAAFLWMVAASQASRRHFLAPCLTTLQLSAKAHASPYHTFQEPRPVDTLDALGHLSGDDLLEEDPLHTMKQNAREKKKRRRERKKQVAPERDLVVVSKQPGQSAHGAQKRRRVEAGSDGTAEPLGSCRLGSSWKLWPRGDSETSASLLSYAEMTHSLAIGLLHKYVWPLCH